MKPAGPGEERAKHRIAAIRAAATGADPGKAAAKKSKLTPSDTAGNVGPVSGEQEWWKIEWPY